MASKLTDADKEPGETLKIACELVAAYVGNNSVNSADLPGLLEDVFSKVDDLANYGFLLQLNQQPAVPIEKSVTNHYIICLEDGKKLKMLKRYLRTHYDLSLEEYKKKWNLPSDYPTVAPSYAKRRSGIAKDFGLGTSANSERKKSKAKSRKRKR